MTRRVSDGGFEAELGQKLAHECVDHPAETRNEPVAFTVMAKRSGYLTKLIKPTEDGAGFVKDGSFCRMSSGTARRVEAADLREVAAILGGLKPNEAITLGVFADDAEQADIVSKAAFRDGARTRTKGGPEGFVFHEHKPGLLLIDMDLDERLEGYDGTVESAWRLLSMNVPWLEGVGYIGRASTSSGIFLGDQRLDDPRKAGMHFYLVVRDGSEVPNILKRIDSELWLKGLGRIKISTSGQRLFRTPVDASVGSPERLVFEAPPVLEGGLTQRERSFSVVEGKPLGLADVPPLGAVDSFKLAELRREAYDAPKIAADKKREVWVENRRRVLVGQYVEAGMGEPEARARASADMASWQSAILLGGVSLRIDTGVGDDHEEHDVTVDALYASPAEWDGCYCRDPEEPEKGPQKARLRLDASGWLYLHSWLGGGRTYLLRPSLEGVLDRVTRWADLTQAQQSALLRDCGRVDTDDVGSLSIVEALVARGLRRGDVNRIIGSERKEARRVVSEHGQSGGNDTPFERRPVSRKATQAEIAQDARAALTTAGTAPIFDQDNFYMFDDGIWQAIEKSTLRTWIGMSYRHCEVVRRAPDCKAVLSALADATAKPTFFDDTRPGVAVGDSFWTVLPTGELQEEALRAEHGVRFRLPFAPDFSCGEPEMLGKLFTMVFAPGDRDDLAFSLGALMGCAVLGLGHVFKEAGFLIGTGDTGKSTLGALLCHFLPKSAVSAVPLGKMGEEYSLSQLAGARLNLPGEEAADVVIPAAALKQITGGDPLSARRPYGQPFSFVSRALQWFTANRMPPLREHEKQIYRRIVFIPFSTEIPAEERIGKTAIAARKMFEAEGPQILGWAMTCAAKAVALETMQTPATLAASEDWRKTEDSVLGAFFGGDACFTVSGDECDQTPAAWAYQTYKSWTQEAGRKPLGRNTFYDRVKSSQDLRASGVLIAEDRKGQKILTGVINRSAAALQRMDKLMATVPRDAEANTSTSNS